MTGNRVFYFRVHDGSHSTRKGLMIMVMSFRVNYSQPHFQGSFVSTALYARISRYVFVPLFCDSVH